eukprot:TRINITY_DN87920_c0_g1_i1.p1 TRINITY_DN87920_c0_g1~~TRINITY_DN87920_c0_g1_i1.p1  ORF type:complete len:439 (-),score=80.32 TRINITY_DN87920_c0_g1_i1:427-1653(-)
MPKDCFVSVKIGDAVKLCKLGDSRLYKFPKANQQAPGTKMTKIEVFHRIGVYDMHLDASDLGNREVSIDCNASGFGSLDMNVHIDDLPPQAKPVEPDKKAARMEAVQKYLAHHNVETQLAKAMQVLLFERPDDPLDFLATQLKKFNSLPPSPASKKPEPTTKTQSSALVGARPEPVLPMKNYFPQHMKRCPGECLSNLYSKFPVRKLERSEPTGQLGARPSPVLPMKDYITQHVRSCPSEHLEKLYAKFPAPGRSTSQAKPSAAASQVKPAVAPTSFRFKASVGTWLMTHQLGPKLGDSGVHSHSQHAPTVKQSEHSIAPMKVYYDEHIHSCPAERMETLYAKFPPKSRIAAPRKPAAAKSPPVHLKPSVGTWLQQQHRFVPKNAEPFHLKPSVGTWLMTFRGKQASI